MTPDDALSSRASPGVRFPRIPPAELSRLREELHPVVLTDNYAPVDRLIGVE